MKTSRETLIQRVREECVKEFIRAYEEGGIKGLCEEGRIEYAVDAVRSLDFTKLINED